MYEKVTFVAVTSQGAKLRTELEHVILAEAWVKKKLEHFRVSYGKARYYYSPVSASSGGP